MKKRLLVLIATLVIPALAFCRDQGLDQKIDEWFGWATGWFVQFIFYQIPFTENVSVYWVLFPLILGALYFTVYFGFINFTGFRTSINIVRGKYDDLEPSGHVEVSPSKFTGEEDNPDTIRVEGKEQGEVSHFQALTAALSATVGLGNIAGVAIAVSIGGAGATFWMIVAGFLGMASKFTECTLGVKYRDIGPDGTVYGGPMYYLTKGLKSKGFGKLGKVLAVVFAIMCIGGSFGGGNMFQVNQAYQLFESMTQTQINQENLSVDKYLYIEPGVYNAKVLAKNGTSYKVSKIEDETFTLKNENIDHEISIGLSQIQEEESLNFLANAKTDEVVNLPQAYLDPIYSSLVGNNFLVNSITGDNVAVQSAISGTQLSFDKSELISKANVNTLFGYGWLFGLIMAILVGIVIIGGIKSIAKVTDKIVPFMVVIYVGAALFVLIAKYDQIGWAFGEILSGAFSPEGVIGGAVGVLIQGFRRAAFSNEAGIGSASIAHAAVKTNHPASEGMVALLEPFIDTVLVCTMTALVLIITGNVNPDNGSLNDAQAILLTSGAFESVISWFPWILTIAVILFAFSTMISWSYYGYQAWSYLVGRSKKMEYLYKLVFCLFVIVGAAASLGSVIGFSDAMIFAMMVPNMVGLVILAPKVKEELVKYLAAIKTAKAAKASK